jgi:hypothetical protein
MAKMNFNKIYIDENIFYIKDFIDRESLSILKKDIEEQSVVNKNHEGLYHDILSFSTKQSQLIWNKITSDLEFIFDNDIEYLYDFPPRPYVIKYVNRSTSPELSHWAMVPHSDNGAYESDPGKDSNNVLKGIVIYITDDFDGGEIVYVNKEIEFSPKAGYLVCHPGSEEYKHGVNRFTGGDRIIVTGFVHERKKPN